MKLNLIVRIKNPWFWIGLGAIIFSAVGLDPAMFTSWNLVWEAIVDLFSNPFRLFTAAFAVLAVFIDPTTSGIGDSTQALTYLKPKK